MAKQELNIDPALGDDMVERIRRDNSGREIGIITLVIDEEGRYHGVITNLEIDIMEDIVIRFASNLMLDRIKGGKVSVVEID